MKKLSTLTAAVFVLLLLCSCSAQDKAEAAVKDILKYCNEERGRENLPELKLDSEMCDSALIRATEIAKTDKLEHTRPDSSGCFTVLTVSYTKAGENLAKGKTDGEELVKAWMKSELHRKNIMDSDFSRAGIAYSEKDGEYYWVMLFCD